MTKHYSQKTLSSVFGNYILKFALSMYVLEVISSAVVFASVLAFPTFLHL
jgi:hypothetical protein